VSVARAKAAASAANFPFLAAQAGDPPAHPIAGREKTERVSLFQAKTILLDTKTGYRAEPDEVEAEETAGI